MMNDETKDAEKRKENRFVSSIRSRVADVFSRIELSQTE